MQPHVKINDESLRNLFGSYGELEDVAIKQSIIDRNTHCQRGYAFVCFVPSEEGIAAALKVAEVMSNVEIDQVNYRCEVSRTLESRISPPKIIAPAPYLLSGSHLQQQPQQPHQQQQQQQRNSGENFSAGSSMIQGGMNIYQQQPHMNPRNPRYASNSAGRRPVDNTFSPQVPMQSYPQTQQQVIQQLLPSQGSLPQSMMAMPMQLRGAMDPSAVMDYSQTSPNALMGGPVMHPRPQGQVYWSADPVSPQYSQPEPSMQSFAPQPPPVSYPMMQMYTLPYPQPGSPFMPSAPGTLPTSQAGSASGPGMYQQQAGPPPSLMQSMYMPSNLGPSPPRYLPSPSSGGLNLSGSNAFASNNPPDRRRSNMNSSIGGGSGGRRYDPSRQQNPSQSPLSQPPTSSQAPYNMQQPRSSNHPRQNYL